MPLELQCFVQVVKQTYYLTSITSNASMQSQCLANHTRYGNVMPNKVQNQKEASRTCSRTPMTVLTASNFDRKKQGTVGRAGGWWLLCFAVSVAHNVPYQLTWWSSRYGCLCFLLEVESYEIDPYSLDSSACHEIVAVCQTKSSRMGGAWRDRIPMLPGVVQFQFCQHIC